MLKIFKEKGVNYIVVAVLVIISSLPAVRSQGQWFAFGRGYAGLVVLMSLICVDGALALFSLITYDVYARVMGMSLYVLMPTVHYIICHERILAGIMVWAIAPWVVTIFVILWRKKPALLIAFCATIVAVFMLLYHFNRFSIRELFAQANEVTRYEVWNYFTIYATPEGFPALGLGAVAALFLMIWVGFVLRAKSNGSYKALLVLFVVAVVLSLKSVFVALVHTKLFNAGVPVLKNSMLMWVIGTLVSVLAVQAVGMLKEREKGSFATIYVPLGIAVMAVGAYLVAV